MNLRFGSASDAIVAHGKAMPWPRWSRNRFHSIAMLRMANHFYTGMMVVFLTGGNAGCMRRITASNRFGFLITMPFRCFVHPGDEFVILNPVAMTIPNLPAVRGQR